MSKPLYEMTATSTPVILIVFLSNYLSFFKNLNLEVILLSMHGSMGQAAEAP